MGDDEIRIVGVAEDTAHVSIDDRTRPMVYLSQLETPRSYFRFLVRGDDPRLFARSIQETVSTIDPEIPVVEVRTMEDVMAEASLPRRVMSISLSGLSLGALLLAAVGLYGLMAFFVAQQTREIGVRLALGASPTEILKMVVARGMKLALIGAAAGVVGSIALARLMGDLLIDASQIGVVAFVAIPVVVFALAVLATAAPAIRASRLEPSSVLRME